MNQEELSNLYLGRNREEAIRRLMWDGFWIVVILLGIFTARALWLDAMSPSVVQVKVSAEPDGSH